LISPVPTSLGAPRRIALLLGVTLLAVVALPAAAAVARPWSFRPESLNGAGNNRGITYRHTLGQLISMDAGVPASQLPRNVFFAPHPP
jgi:hypothetical protein